MLTNGLQDVKRHILCYDISGEALEARLVFQHCIKCLKDYLYKQIEMSLLGTQDGDIEYVLTVPAIWGDKAKMFMREAALKVKKIKQIHKGTANFFIYMY